MGKEEDQKGMHNNNKSSCLLNDHAIKEEEEEEEDDDHQPWMMIMDDDRRETSNLSSSSEEEESFSGESSESSLNSYSSDLVEEDEASSSSSSSSFNSIKENSPLYELSELMANLPIKRGLSKFYQGKSQSFASLKRVTSLDDLAKKENPFRRRKIKPCKSYGACLGTTLPKSAISKKKVSSRIRASFLSRLTPPCHVQKHF